MEAGHLKKLKRDQLLELMLQQQEKIEEQEAKILELQNELNRKTITLKESGSIAEATLALNGVFEAAQAAADQYLLSIKEKNSQGEKDEIGRAHV